MNSLPAHEQAGCCIPPRQAPNPGERLPDLFGDARWRQIDVLARLSRRQAEVARMICRGCENQQIAEQLGFSIETGRLHTKKLLKQLKVRNRVSVLARHVLLTIDRLNTFLGMSRYSYA